MPLLVCAIGRILNPHSIVLLLTLSHVTLLFSVRFNKQFSYILIVKNLETRLEFQIPGFLNCSMNQSYIQTSAFILLMSMHLCQ